MDPDSDLPDYLVEVVARQAYEADRISPVAWEDADEVTRKGFLETARTILRARAAQTDIKR